MSWLAFVGIPTAIKTVECDPAIDQTRIVHANARFVERFETLKPAPTAVQPNTNRLVFFGGCRTILDGLPLVAKTRPVRSAVGSGVWLESRSCIVGTLSEQRLDHKARYRFVANPSSGHDGLPLVVRL